jgi:hypothetical protein
MDKVFSKVKDLETMMSDIAYKQEQAVVNRSQASQRIIQESNQRIVPV